MPSYAEILQQIDQQVASLIQKDGRLSEADALSQVFKRQPALYQAYRRLSGTQPATRAPLPPRQMPEPTGAEAEVLKRADRLVMKGDGVSLADAISEVLREDQDLYTRYRMEAGQAPLLPPVDPDAPLLPPVDPDAPLPAWEPPDRELFRYIPADAQRALILAAGRVAENRHQHFLHGFSAVTKLLKTLR